VGGPYVQVNIEMSVVPLFSMSAIGGDDVGETSLFGEASHTNLRSVVSI